MPSDGFVKLKKESRFGGTIRIVKLGLLVTQQLIDNRTSCVRENEIEPALLLNALRRRRLYLLSPPTERHAVVKSTKGERIVDIGIQRV